MQALSYSDHIVCIESTEHSLQEFEHSTFQLDLPASQVALLVSICFWFCSLIKSIIFLQLPSHGRVPLRVEFITLFKTDTWQSCLLIDGNLSRLAVGAIVKRSRNVSTAIFLLHLIADLFRLPTKLDVAFLKFLLFFFSLYGQGFNSFCSSVSILALFRFHEFSKGQRLELR